MITGFCTAINPIDFTIWTSIVLFFGIMIGILISSLYFKYLTKSKGSPEDYEFMRKSFKEFRKWQGRSPYPSYSSGGSLEHEVLLSTTTTKCQLRKTPEKEEWCLLLRIFLVEKMFRTKFLCIGGFRDFISSIELSLDKILKSCQPFRSFLKSKSYHFEQV